MSKSIEVLIDQLDLERKISIHRHKINFLFNMLEAELINVTYLDKASFPGPVAIMSDLCDDAIELENTFKVVPEALGKIKK